jgi:ribosomal-protein-alanine N-acetyltransferase
MSLIGTRYWPVTLERGPVRLRPIRRADEAEWNAVRDRNAEWLRPWDSTRPPESDEGPRTFAQMAADFTRAAREGTMLPWVIGYRTAPGASEVLAGQMTISGIARGSARWAMAGYWVDQAWAGRGLAPISLALAADHLFFTLRLHRLEVAIRPENAKSLRVVEKLGLRYEGERARYLHVDGDWRDHLMFAIHADEVGPGGLIGRLGR